MSARRFFALSVPSAVAATLVLLGLLASLQYRWAGELSAAENARLRSEARNHAEALSREFDLEVTRAFIGLQLGGEALARGDFSSYAERYETWRRSTAYSSLVKDVLLVEPAGDALALRRYVAARGEFEPAQWSAALEPVRRRVTELAQPRERGPGPPPPGRAFGPIIEEVPALVLFGFGGEARFTARAAAPPESGTVEVRRGVWNFRRGDGPPPPPLPSGFPGVRVERRGPELRFEILRPRDVMVVILDADVIRNRFLPALAERHFAGADGLDYDLTVVRQEDRGHVVWQSRPEGPSRERPDAAAGLLDLRFEELQTGEFRRMGGLRAHTEDTGAWRLLVSHRAGPLETVVAAARRRNLAVGFGILLLLGASVALVVVSSQRARRLGEQQMEFVAAVSHELRTPVAAICSTSENLRDGLIDDPAQVRSYGTAIHAEGRRLAEMVERVLEFAGTTRARPAAPPEDVEVAALVDAALRPFESDLEERGFTVVRDVAPGLPVVRGDAFALRRALQNLVENALKYDKGGRFLAVRAGAAKGGRRVRITVEDHGDGIAPAELDHVFEPFFRGREARAAQLPGFGLGLPLVRRVIEMHGGRLDVSSAPGRGTTFTLDLPGAVPPSAPPHPPARDVVTNPDR
jgi:signal transduction histidine kinase